MKIRKLKYKYWYPFSVEIEIQLRKFRRFVDRLYLKVWRFILAFWIILCLFWGYLMFMHDYNLIHNCANLDAPFQSFYTDWNTYGSPGHEPPQK